MAKQRDMRFTVTGTMRVSGRMLRDSVGDIRGYKLPDGREIRLCVALEVEDQNGNTSMAYTDQDMKKLGFEIQSYDETNFS